MIFPSGDPPIFTPHASFRYHLFPCLRFLRIYFSFICLPFSQNNPPLFMPSLLIQSPDFPAGCRISPQNCEPCLPVCWARNWTLAVLPTPVSPTRRTGSPLSTARATPSRSTAECLDKPNIHLNVTPVMNCHRKLRQLMSNRSGTGT